MRAREMKVPPPSAWPEGARHATLATATFLAVALLLVAKRLAIGPFVAALVPASAVSLVAVLALGVGAGRALRLSTGEAVLTSLPALVILLVALANTPMPYEAKAFAASMPHPEGGERTLLRALRPFEARHPSTQVEWSYAEGNATSLTLALRDALAEASWDVRSASTPGANAFGYVLAQRYGFTASCTVWPGPPARVACLVTA